MITGKVKFYDSERGFGFIVPDDKDATSGKDVFVHVSELKAARIKDLETGAAVRFTLGEHRGRAVATDLHLA